ncbi:hypothetical protein BDQ12DRAFT_769442 [Crucibulum laeve]|uniref:Uncharacterized protein n=1 Tax=Crucibulum laeve TaxID=68775 RepID=A0A5C3LJ22_9AGAR|nr:hypothetical protein BDQ12DRAFT_769442 [Crucibulum laeve]
MFYQAIPDVGLHSLYANDKVIQTNLRHNPLDIELDLHNTPPINAQSPVYHSLSSSRLESQIRHFHAILTPFLYEGASFHNQCFSDWVGAITINQGFMLPPSSVQRVFHREKLEVDLYSNFLVKSGVVEGNWHRFSIDPGVDDHRQLEHCYITLSLGRSNSNEVYDSLFAYSHKILLSHPLGKWWLANRIDVELATGVEFSLSFDIHKPLGPDIYFFLAAPAIDDFGSIADLQFFWSRDPTGKSRLSTFETGISPPKIITNFLQICLDHQHIVTLQTLYHSLGLGQDPNAIIELFNLPPIELYFSKELNLYWPLQIAYTFLLLDLILTKERVTMISTVVSQKAILIRVNDVWLLALDIQTTARGFMHIG